jgi:hypothetical protein
MVPHAPHASEEIDKGWSLFPNETRYRKLPPTGDIFAQVL